MYKVNDMVIYGWHGVCRVEEMAVKEFDGKRARR